MFSLAHLSDPHIGPIATPRLRELANKRGLGLINWYRKRHRHHHADVLDAIVADMHAQKPSHIAVTGDLVNISLDTEFAGAGRSRSSASPRRCRPGRSWRRGGSAANSLRGSPRSWSRLRASRCFASC